MAFSIETPQTLPDRKEVHDLLHEFYTLQTRRLREDGGPNLSPDQPVSGFWNDLELFLPPKGALTLARAEEGHLIGCGAISDIGDGTAELKYLYVRPEARGTGVGRVLVQARIEIARQMGLSQICVDTLKASVEMHQLYESMGFERIDEFAQSKSIRDLPALAPFMRFYRMAL
jgi:GNAT superfamily N-acetyltransferase